MTSSWNSPRAELLLASDADADADLRICSARFDALTVGLWKSVIGSRVFGCPVLVTCLVGVFGGRVGEAYKAEHFGCGGATEDYGGVVVFAVAMREIEVRSFRRVSGITSSLAFQPFQPP